MSLDTPPRGRLRRVLPYSGRMALITAFALILMLLVLVAVAIYVASQEPPATQFEPQGPTGAATAPGPGHTAVLQATASGAELRRPGLPL